MNGLHPPASDEIEITVFGRGVGECVVAHVGQDQWLIIDSYVSEHRIVDARSGRPRQVPVARWYLEELGVARDCVGEIIITHLHSDHYLGVARLHDHYTDAQLLVTAALGDEVIRQVFADPATADLLPEISATMANAKRRKRGRFESGLRTLGVEWCRLYAPDVSLRALSPVDAALRDSMAMIAERMTRGSRPELRTALRKQNLTSVTLHLHTPAGRVLLCGDLETSPAKYGWEAVLAEPSHQHLKRADVVKVGHHGSENGDHREMWDRLVDCPPAMAVTPFTRLTDKLPKRSDWQRLCDRGELYQAAPSFELAADSFGYLSGSEGPTGFIQARRRPGEDAWRIQFGGAAFHVNPVLAQEELITSG